MTDGSAWGRPGAQGAHQPTSGGWSAPGSPAQPSAPPRHTAGGPGFGSPSQVAYPQQPYQQHGYPQAQHQPGTFPSGQGGPAAGTWWSDALADPWRDPDAQVVLVKRPASEPPALERPVERQGARAGLGLVVLISLVTALLAGALGGTLVYVFALRGGGSTLAGGKLDNQAPLNQRPPDSLAALAKKVLPSVVTISIRSGNGAALGSGFVVSPDGYIVTNYHVVEGGSGNPQVRFVDATVVPATIVGSEPESDIAVIKVDPAALPKNLLVPVEFGDSDRVQVGDPVVAVGAPLGLTSTLTYGVVSYIDRPIQTSEGGTKRYYAAIQTDAAVNQGNSGGPLFDAGGRVVGINSVIGTLAADQQSAGNVGLAFAIPFNQARRMAQDIIDTGKARRTVIGVTPDASYRSAQGGAKISAVEPSGPAANAGLRAGDVILTVNGHPLDEGPDLVALVRKYAPGAVVEVDYLRSGVRQKVSVTLAADAK